MQCVTPMSDKKVEIRAFEERDNGDLYVEAIVSTLPGWEVGLLCPLDGEHAYAVSELTLRPAWDDTTRSRPMVPGGVKAATLRALPIQEILRAGFAGDKSTGTMSWLLDSMYPEEAPKFVTNSNGKGGRPVKYTPAHYARVAVDWERHTQKRRGALGRFASDAGVKQSTVRGWVAEATERGYLRPAQSRGARIRHATEKAWTVLQEHDQQREETTS